MTNSFFERAEQWYHIRALETRTVAGWVPVAGVVLLFGIGLLGASLAVANGSGWWDGLESEANAERTLSAVSTTEKRVSTAAFPDEAGRIPFDDVPASDASVTADDRVAMTRYDGSSGDPEDVGTGDSSSEPATSDDDGIEVDTTYIVIE